MSAWMWILLVLCAAEVVVLAGVVAWGMGMFLRGAWAFMEVWMRRRVNKYPLTKEEAIALGIQPIVIHHPDGVEVTVWPDAVCGIRTPSVGESLRLSAHTAAADITGGAL